jgi:hypothetical protein
LARRFRRDRVFALVAEIFSLRGRSSHEEFKVPLT